MEKENIPQLDIKFCDLIGSWHHITMMRESLDDAILESGVGFDSSSVPKFKDVYSGDMVAKPDLKSCFIDKTFDRPTLGVIADIVEGGPYKGTELDPRSTLKRATAFLKETGLADRMICAPELEFYLFNEAGFTNDPYGAKFFIEAPGVGRPLGSESVGASERLMEGRGYMTAHPQDWWQNRRAEMAAEIEEIGLPVRYHHVEVGAAGQQEIELGFMDAITTADAILIGKYIVRWVAVNNNIEACFMPKPIADAAGNGLHIHFRLLKDGKNLMAGDGYGGLSEFGKHFLGGVLSHGRSLLALFCPSTNSYRRLRPGHESPIRFFYSVGNREAAVRIPKYSIGPNTRCEFRPGDATMNPYLAIAALLMAGIDGVENRIDPTPLKLGPYDGKAEEIDPETHPHCILPKSLSQSLREFEADHEFLLKGNVFNETMIRNFIDYKRSREIYAMQGAPHPLEFEMYWGL